ncbi:glycosyltransferase family 4 protein [Spirosoma aerolatum]|uniref:glycosyltransferase family 4 protein n=1 Tax=Spirosoma aerolatum TaxID=1211326 RepID=UPI0009AC7353|nr:glycosyltransferase family 1 protein [Spirosoma aerolatum]
MAANIVVNARFLTQQLTGTQRFAIGLCFEIKKNFPDVIFVCPNRIIHHEVAKELNVVIIGYSQNGLFWEQVELPIYLSKQGFPLLISLGNEAPVIYSKNIVAVLDLAFFHNRNWYSKTFSFIFNTIVPLVARRALHIITISEYSKQDIVKTFGISADNIDLIYPTVAEKFLAAPRKDYPNKYGRYILGVSSIDPRKNFIGLVKAFRASGLTDTKLVIVGQQHKVFADSQLKSLIEGDESIIFTGYVDDVELVNLYHHAMLFAYPSYFEGFGIPPLEAMACGCPTLVSNTTSMPEVCGDASLYVDPYDIDSIRKGLIRAISDVVLREQMVTRGYSRVQYFINQDVSRQFADIIEKAVKKSS